MKSLILVLSLAAALVPPAFAATPTPATPAEYKRADANFYWKGDVLKVEPNAVIVPEGGFTQQNDSYFITGQKKAPKIVYAQVVNDWVEPISPPDGTPLNVPTNTMQIREPQGDVQVAFPSAPATFLPVQDGMTVADGTVVKTGADSTAAVVFGGVASARLIPNSEAAVQQTLTPGLRSTEIDLTRGAIFSKVGKPIDEKEDYTVHTPFGVAAARGTDFVSVAMPARTDVWIAQGTVQLTQPNGTAVGQISAEGTGPLKIIRFPLMPDPHDAMMASAQTMTAAMNFIPMANQNVKALRDRMAKGEKLSDSEMKYLSLIKKVPCLIKLVLVPPVTPPPAPKLPPVEPSPATKAAATPNPAAAVHPAHPAVLNIHLRPNGTVSFQNATISLDDLKTKLAAIAAATPDQAVAIKAGKKVSYDNVQKVLTVCYDAGIKKVAFTLPPKTPAPVSSPAVPATTNAPPPQAPPVQQTPATTIP